MILTGYVYTNDGITISAKGMQTQLSLLNVHTDNISNFGVPGYQRKEPVITSFAEFLGPNAVDAATDTTIGRLRKSGYPLDLALGSHGYFQKINPTGTVETTRDGRLILDKDGYLRALDGKKILSAAGTPLKFPSVPQDLEKEVRITPDGDVRYVNSKTNAVVYVGRIGVVNEDGFPTSPVDVKQGYVEDANVMLQNEFEAIIPLRRQFEGNRQMFIIQNDALSRMIQELGRTQ